MSSLAADKTELLFWANSYLTEFDAKILAITKKGVVLDRTVFYPTGGGSLTVAQSSISEPEEDLKIISKIIAEYK